MVAGELYEGMAVCQQLQQYLIGEHKKLLMCRLEEKSTPVGRVVANEPIEFSEVSKATVAIADTVTRGVSGDLGRKGLATFGFNLSAARSTELASTHHKCRTLRFPPQKGPGNYHCHLIILKAQILDHADWLPVPDDLTRELQVKIADLTDDKDAYQLKGLVLKECWNWARANKKHRLKWWFAKPFITVAEIDVTLRLGYQFTCEGVQNEKEIFRTHRRSRPQECPQENAERLLKIILEGSAIDNTLRRS